MNKPIDKVLSAFCHHCGKTVLHRLYLDILPDQPNAKEEDVVLAKCPECGEDLPVPSGKLGYVHTRS